MLNYIDNFMLSCYFARTCGSSVKLQLLLLVHGCVCLYSHNLTLSYLVVNGQMYCRNTVIPAKQNRSTAQMQDHYQVLLSCRVYFGCLLRLPPLCFCCSISLCSKLCRSSKALQMLLAAPWPALTQNRSYNALAAAWVEKPLQVGRPPSGPLCIFLRC